MTTIPTIITGLRLPTILLLLETVDFICQLMQVDTRTEQLRTALLSIHQERRITVSEIVT